MAIRISAALLSLAVVAAQASGANYTADFNSSTLDPNLDVVTINNGVTPGANPPWTVTSGGGYLTIAKGINPTPNDDLINVVTHFATPGDFVAQVTVDWSGNANGWGGYYLYSATGATGFGFGTNGLWDSAFGGFPGGGNSGVTPTSVMTFEIARSGNTLTKSYKLAGDANFTVLSTLTDNMVLGDAYLEMDNYSNIVPATSLRFSDFSIQTSAVPEPAAYALLLGGLGCLVLSRRRLRG